MIIYTPRYETRMVEEPTYITCYTAPRAQRVVTRRRRDPVNDMFQSMIELATPRRVERRPRRKSIFDTFFDDDTLFSQGNIFDSMFPRLRRFTPDHYTDQEEEDQMAENKENIHPQNEQNEAETDQTVEEPVSERIFSRVFNETITRDEDGNINRVVNQRTNKNGKIKETEQHIIEDETGEIKEEAYFLNGNEVEKMALESESTETEQDDEDDGWVIRPIENTENSTQSSTSN
jgi:hypothetical protein